MTVLALNNILQNLTGCVTFILNGEHELSIADFSSAKYQIQEKDGLLYLGASVPTSGTVKYRWHYIEIEKISAILQDSLR